jgi:hypothetical protein
MHHRWSPGVVAESPEPGVARTPHTSPTAGDSACDSVLALLGHDSVPVATSSLPRWVPGCRRTGRVTGVALAFTEIPARATPTRARERDGRCGESREAGEGEVRCCLRCCLRCGRGAVPRATTRGGCGRCAVVVAVAVAVYGAVVVALRLRSLCSRGRGGGRSLRCCCGRTAVAVVAEPHEYE